MAVNGKILVIDDDALISSMMEMDLGEDFEVCTANSGTEGIAAAKEFQPSIILLDVNMPDMTGVDVTRELRSDAETMEIPVVIITGASFSKETEAELRHYPNFKTMLSKMTPAAEVRKLVERLIKERR